MRNRIENTREKASNVVYHFEAQIDQFAMYFNLANYIIIYIKTCLLMIIIFYINNCFVDTFVFLFLLECHCGFLRWGVAPAQGLKDRNVCRKFRQAFCGRNSINIAQKLR